MVVAVRFEEAVSHMATGCYGKAVNLLDQILDELRMHLSAHDVAHGGIFDRRLSLPSVEASLGPVCIAPMPRPNSEYRLFERAIMIQQCDDAVWVAEENVAVATAATLYNKALILHLLGEGDTSRLDIESYITKARLLYEKALCLINTCSPSPDNNFGLKCALLNNIGKICYHVNDRPAEQIFLMGMEKILNHRLKHHAFEGDEARLLFNVILLFGAHRPSPAA